MLCVNVPSRLSVGFRVKLLVERKMGKAALAELTLYPTEWKNAYWAKEQGLYAKVYDSISEMDKELDIHIQKLATYNPEALAEMKKVLWEGTEHWDDLLLERAEASGRLALSPNTKNALEKFKK